VSPKSFVIVVAAIMAATLLAGCSDHARAIEQAERLTPQQLQRVFCMVEAMPDRGRLRDDEMPAELKTIGARYVAREFMLANVTLAGAVDDKVALHLVGLGRPGEKRIFLWPGERQPQRLLWSAPATGQMCN
jgi:hypothetical protein